MKVWELAGSFGIDNVRIGDRPDPSPGPGEALVAVAAASLNFRDHLMVQGVYNPRQKLPVVLLSDGAGTVLDVGAGVTSVRPGDRVLGSFFPAWQGGAPTPVALTAQAYPGDGVLAERRNFRADGLFPIPDALSFAEAATLPCAALTAWSAIVTLGATKPGDLVLVQGTGGVALFALQFAKAAGARVVVISSSDDKLDRARALGADFGINYRSTPDWGKAALAWSGGRAMDHVVELGGADTLDKSIRAVAPGGMLSMIGVLGGPAPAINLPLVVMRQVRLQGVTVGSNDGLVAMLRAIDAHGIKPVIDATFGFAEAKAALALMAEARAFGKIVVTV